MPPAHGLSVYIKFSGVVMPIGKVLTVELREADSPCRPDEPPSLMEPIEVTIPVTFRWSWSWRMYLRTLAAQARRRAWRARRYGERWYPN